MTQQSTDRPRPSKPPAAHAETPPFKPVALPALAAAVHAVRPQPNLPRNQELPAILRKESLLG